MTYTRKTVDTYQLWVNYGQGWEHEITEMSYREKIEQAKCYRENCPYPTKWIVKREPIG